MNFLLKIPGPFLVFLGVCNSQALCRGNYAARHRETHCAHKRGKYEQASKAVWSECEPWRDKC